MKLIVAAGFVAALMFQGALMAEDAARHGVRAWPGEYGKLKVLNNLVTELLTVSAVGDTPGEYAFANPRTGWVFLSLHSAQKGSGSPKAILDDRSEPLVWRVHPKSGAFENMQLLAEGRHRLRVEGAHGMRLDVRAVPEIAYCYYPTRPHIACYGPYDWAYMERHVLPDVNTLVTRSAVKPEEFAQWRSEGRQWISNASLPGLGSPEAPTVDEVYGAWAKNAVMTQPGFGGLIVDEFCGSDKMHYGAWGEAVKRLHDDPGFGARTFYAWCGTLYDQAPSLEFARLLMDLGYRFCWEVYLREEPTAEKTDASFAAHVTKPWVQWQEALPGVAQRMVLCLGYLSAPPESLNANPAADYQVFLDMQFYRLAVDPAFFGLYGIMEYMADYADEESLRYAQELFRHYCIEGKRTPHNNDPYVLPHVDNPDFENGLKGWRAEPAEEGAIEAKAMKGFSWLEGRYPQTRAGDTFCWMKRSAARPNRVTQTIKLLDPKRLYSVKLLSADLGQLDKSQQTAISIGIEDAEILDKYGFQFVFPSCYSHEVKPYTKDHPAYMSFHRVVFRPKARKAKLVISDWSGATEPGGPAGQETVFNFVEVQPFHAP